MLCLVLTVHPSSSIPCKRCFSLLYIPLGCHHHLLFFPHSHPSLCMTCHTNDMLDSQPTFLPAFLLQVISGQYVCPESNTGSPQVEVELIGIPVDCSKQRSRVIQRNSLNPIFNDTFIFKVRTPDSWYTHLVFFQVCFSQDSFTTDSTSLTL
jgi:hypothetical protein